jgi:P-type E1-E2 ATPase
MIKVTIPGKQDLELEHVVFDVNGTLALDGQLLPGIPDLLNTLKDQVKIHLLTADTHGKQDEIDRDLNLKAVRVQAGNEARQKADYVEKLGAKNTVAVGQGKNDSQMVRTAALGICILSPEGTSIETLSGSDLVVPNIQSAVEILLNPSRLRASLRN